MLDKAPPQSKHIDESNAAASLLSMETTANNHRYEPPRPLMANSSQNARVRTEDDGADETSSRHPAISSASIESVKTTYDENPLLSIMKSTCAPNNTPVHTPSGSPSLQVQGGNDAKNDGDDDSKGKNVAAAAASFQVRRNSDNAPHTAASPHAPSNTPSGVSSLCHSRPAQANVLQVSDAVRPRRHSKNDVVFSYSSASTSNNPASTTVVGGAKEKINLPPPPAISSPVTTAAGSGSGSGLRSRTGSQNLPPITSANKDDGKNTNSPLSILGRKNSNNDSKALHGSDSRDSSNNSETGGFLRGETKPGGNSPNDSKTQHSDADDQYAMGVAPRNFYFNKDREITDPNVKLDENDSKVNISFWLNSKYRDEAYSLNESTSNNISSNTDTPANSRHTNNSSSVPSRNNFQHFRFNQIPSQPPTSASSFTSNNNNNNNNNNQRNTIHRGEDPFATSSRPSTGFFYGDLPNRNKNSPFHPNEPYVPPPPPKYINSKLDGLRSRLLLGPNSASSSTKLDDDLGTAAAVLSNMRSSPYRSHEKPISNVNNNNKSTNTLAVPASRPHSSSFPSKGVLRPILLRIHNSEQQPIFESNNSTAVSDEDQDLSNYYLHPSQNSNSKKVLDPTFESRARQVTWNKNGKRIDRRLSAPEQQQQQQQEEPALKRSRRSVGNAGATSQNNSDYNSLGESSTSSAPSSPSLKASSSSLAYGTEYSNAVSPDTNKSKGKTTKSKTKSKSKQSSKKRSNNNSSKSKANDSQELNNTASSSAAQGTRSRTGCWICRLRKKKCTEERPNCFNCERLKLDCHYDAFKPDFVSDPKKKQMKLEEIKKKTKEAKRRAMKKK